MKNIVIVSILTLIFIVCNQVSATINLQCKGSIIGIDISPIIDKIVPEVQPKINEAVNGILTQLNGGQANSCDVAVNSTVCPFRSSTSNRIRLMKEYDLQNIDNALKQGSVVVPDACASAIKNFLCNFAILDCPASGFQVGVNVVVATLQCNATGIPQLPCASKCHALYNNITTSCDTVKNNDLKNVLDQIGQICQALSPLSSIPLVTGLCNSANLVTSSIIVLLSVFLLLL